MIELSEVHGGYGERMIVRGVSLRVERGEFFALLGPNGSGKTTLLKLITGLLPPARGSVLLDGRPACEYSAIARARLVTVLGQEERISFDFTVEEIVALGRYPHQRGWFAALTKEDRAAVEEAMELAQVSAYRHTAFRRLSGGEKQRVLLAKALAQQPRLLLLDEPTNHLDLHHAYGMLSLLKQRQRTHGLTVLAILHDLNMAAMFADRAAILDGGTVAEAGPVSSLIRRTERIGSIYRMELAGVAHPAAPAAQLHAVPAQDPGGQALAWRLDLSDGITRIAFDRAVRTLSNAAHGAGFQWTRHICIAGEWAGQPAAGAGPEPPPDELLAATGMPPETALVLEGADAAREPVIVRKSGPAPVEVVAAGGSGSLRLCVIVGGGMSDGGFAGVLLAAGEAAGRAIADAGGNRSAGAPGAVRSIAVAGLPMPGGDAQREREPALPPSVGQAVYEAVSAAIRGEACSEHLLAAASKCSGTAGDGR